MDAKHEESLRILIASGMMGRANNEAIEASSDRPKLVGVFDDVSLCPTGSVDTIEWRKAAELGITRANPVVVYLRAGLKNTLSNRIFVRRQALLDATDEKNRFQYDPYTKAYFDEGDTDSIRSGVVVHLGPEPAADEVAPAAAAAAAAAAVSDADTDTDNEDATPRSRPGSGTQAQPWAMTTADFERATQVLESYTAAEALAAALRLLDDPASASLYANQAEIVYTVRTARAARLTTKDHAAILSVHSLHFRSRDSPLAAQFLSKILRKWLAAAAVTAVAARAQSSPDDVPSEQVVALLCDQAAPCFDASKHLRAFERSGAPAPRAAVVAARTAAPPTMFVDERGADTDLRIDTREGFIESLVANVGGFAQFIRDAIGLMGGNIRKLFVDSATRALLAEGAAIDALWALARTLSEERSVTYRMSDMTMSRIPIGTAPPPALPAHSKDHPFNAYSDRDHIADYVLQRYMETSTPGAPDVADCNRSLTMHAPDEFPAGSAVCSTRVIRHALHEICAREGAHHPARWTFFRGACGPTSIRLEFSTQTTEQFAQQLRRARLRGSVPATATPAEGTLFVDLNHAAVELGYRSFLEIPDPGTFHVQLTALNNRVWGAPTLGEDLARVRENDELDSAVKRLARETGELFAETYDAVRAGTGARNDGIVAFDTVWRTTINAYAGGGAAASESRPLVAAYRDVVRLLATDDVARIYALTVAAICTHVHAGTAERLRLLRDQMPPPIPRAPLRRLVHPASLQGACTDVEDAVELVTKSCAATLARYLGTVMGTQTLERNSRSAAVINAAIRSVGDTVKLLGRHRTANQPAFNIEAALAYAAEQIRVSQATRVANYGGTISAVEARPPGAHLRTDTSAVPVAPEAAADAKVRDAVDALMTAQRSAQVHTDAPDARAPESAAAAAAADSSTVRPSRRDGARLAYALRHVRDAHAIRPMVLETKVPARASPAPAAPAAAAAAPSSSGRSGGDRDDDGSSSASASDGAFEAEIDARMRTCVDEETPLYIDNRFAAGYIMRTQLTLDRGRERQSRSKVKAGGPEDARTYHAHKTEQRRVRYALIVQRISDARASRLVAAPPAIFEDTTHFVNPLVPLYCGNRVLFLLASEAWSRSGVNPRWIPRTLAESSRYDGRWQPRAALFDLPGDRGAGAGSRIKAAAIVHAADVQYARLHGIADANLTRPLVRPNRLGKVLVTFYRRECVPVDMHDRYCATSAKQSREAALQSHEAARKEFDAWSNDNGATDYARRLDRERRYYHYCELPGDTDRAMWPIRNGGGGDKEGGGGGGKEGASDWKPLAPRLDPEARFRQSERLVVSHRELWDLDALVEFLCANPAARRQAIVLRHPRVTTPGGLLAYRVAAEAGGKESKRDVFLNPSAFAGKDAADVALVAEDVRRTQYKPRIEAHAFALPAVNVAAVYPPRAVLRAVMQRADFPPDEVVSTTNNVGASRTKYFAEYNAPGFFDARLEKALAATVGGDANRVAGVDLRVPHFQVEDVFALPVSRPGLSSGIEPADDTGVAPRRPEYIRADREAGISPQMLLFRGSLIAQIDALARHAAAAAQLCADTGGAIPAIPPIMTLDCVMRRTLAFELPSDATPDHIAHLGARFADERTYMDAATAADAAGRFGFKGTDIRVGIEAYERYVVDVCGPVATQTLTQSGLDVMDRGLREKTAGNRYNDEAKAQFVRAPEDAARPLFRPPSEQDLAGAFGYAQRFAHVDGSAGANDAVHDDDAKRQAAFDSNVPVGVQRRGRMRHLQNALRAAIGPVITPAVHEYGNRGEHKSRTGPPAREGAADSAAAAAVVDEKRASTPSYVNRSTVGARRIASPAVVLRHSDDNPTGRRDVCDEEWTLQRSKAATTVRVDRDRDPIERSLVRLAQFLFTTDVPEEGNEKARTRSTTTCLYPLYRYAFRSPTFASDLADRCASLLTPGAREEAARCIASPLGRRARLLCEVDDTRALEIEVLAHQTSTADTADATDRVKNAAKRHFQRDPAKAVGGTAARDFVLHPIDPRVAHRAVFISRLGEVYEEGGGVRLSHLLLGAVLDASHAHWTVYSRTHVYQHRAVLASRVIVVVPVHVKYADDGATGRRRVTEMRDALRGSGVVANDVRYEVFVYRPAAQRWMVYLFPETDDAFALAGVAPPAPGRPQTLPSELVDSAAVTRCMDGATEADGRVSYCITDGYTASVGTTAAHGAAQTIAYASSLVECWPVETPRAKPKGDAENDAAFVGGIITRLHAIDHGVARRAQRAEAAQLGAAVQALGAEHNRTLELLKVSVATLRAILAHRSHAQHIRTTAEAESARNHDQAPLAIIDMWTEEARYTDALAAMRAVVRVLVNTAEVNNAVVSHFVGIGVIGNTPAINGAIEEAASYIGYGKDALKVSHIAPGTLGRARVDGAEAAIREVIAAQSSHNDTIPATQDSVLLAITQTMGAMTGQLPRQAGDVTTDDDVQLQLRQQDGSVVLNGAAHRDAVDQMQCETDADGNVCLQDSGTHRARGDSVNRNVDIAVDAVELANAASRLCFRAVGEASDVLQSLKPVASGFVNVPPLGETHDLLNAPGSPMIGGGVEGEFPLGLLPPPPLEKQADQNDGDLFL